MRIVKEEPDPKVVKQAVCQNCGATIEYVPNDVRTLWSGTDYGGGPDGAMGFNCPKCGKEVYTKRW
jgi:predicted RNA-binding Zn-ribbon protein involved in translation (DUF1610 family)